MQSVNQIVQELGIAAENTHFEFFGPLEDLQAS